MRARTHTHTQQELLDAGDYAYALQRFTEIRCVEDLRRHVVVGILEAGLYLATDLSKHMRVGRILSLVVPAKIVSRSQLVTGVSGFMANLKTHLLDYPKVREAAFFFLPLMFLWVASCALTP